MYDLLRTETAAICLCGARLPRKRCAFCERRATKQCDGERCIRPICDDHGWTAAHELDFCPPCEVRVIAEARTPKQIGLFA